MSRYQRQPLTFDQLSETGPPIRVKDLMHVTGWSRDSVINSIEAGDIAVLRRTARGSYRILRSEARRWLHQVGFEQAS